MSIRLLSLQPERSILEKNLLGTTELTLGIQHTLSQLLCVLAKAHNVEGSLLHGRGTILQVCNAVQM
jgi:hypothetical protein